jgi:hypothetical protein
VSEPVNDRELCVCGHEMRLHSLEADGTRGLCIRDEWCECPGFQPSHSDERYEQIMREWAVGRLAPK